MPDPLGQFQPRHPGHNDIGQNQIEASGRREDFQCPFRLGHRCGLVSRSVENAGHNLQYLGLVIHHQNLCFSHLCPFQHTCTAGCSTEKPLLDKNAG